jgi:FixJ family two-component response regulator
MSEMAPVVFVVDDDDSVRKSLVRLLRSVGYATRAYASAAAFLDAWGHDPAPGCIDLDVHLPGLNGLDLQDRMKSSDRPLPIIFITGHGDIPMSVRAMKAGAIDFLPKPFHDESLLQAIEEALADQVRRQSERSEHDAATALHAKLTPREREVMMLVVSGLANKHIAAKLGTCVKTIKVHRARVMQKMNVRSVADLVRVSQRVGADPEPRP